MPSTADRTRDGVIKHSRIPPNVGPRRGGGNTRQTVVCLSCATEASPSRRSRECYGGRPLGFPEPAHGTENNVCTLRKCTVRSVRLETPSVPGCSHPGLPGTQQRGSLIGRHPNPNAQRSAPYPPPSHKPSSLVYSEAATYVWCGQIYKWLWPLCETAHGEIQAGGETRRNAAIVGNCPGLCS